MKDSSTVSTVSVSSMLVMAPPLIILKIKSLQVFLLVLNEIMAGVCLTEKILLSMQTSFSTILYTRSSSRSAALLLGPCGAGMLASRAGGLRPLWQVLASLFYNSAHRPPNKLGKVANEPDTKKKQFIFSGHCPYHHSFHVI